jgi:1,4-alpha-glucan branching enzyme
MVKRKPSADGSSTTVTFVLPVAEAVSVVGDFNGWDPLVHPMKKRSNGTRSVSIELPSGQCYPFRYLADGGVFFDEPEADAIEPNGYGDTHSLVTV